LESVYTPVELVVVVSLCNNPHHVLGLAGSYGLP